MKEQGFYARKGTYLLDKKRSSALTEDRIPSFYAALAPLPDEGPATVL